MTREEKAKRYDEAFLRAKNLHKDAINMGENIRAKQCEIIFPELKESEDERIRKDIIEMLRNWASVHYITKEQFSERMAWLEKQGEPNPYSGVSFKYNGHTWGMCARDNGVEILVDGEIKERVLLDNKPQGKSALEAIQEEKVDNANKIEPNINPHFGKTIDKVEPKFKVGDRIKSLISSNYYIVVDILNNNYLIKTDTDTEKFPYYVSFEYETNYELVPNKFDINTLKPFDKVLIRGNSGQKWTIDFFGMIDNYKKYPFACLGHSVTQCIPYEGNEHLLGKTDDCDDFYKTWK